MSDLYTSGMLPGHMPYVCGAGRGPNLVVVPPIRDSLDDVRSARWARHWIRRFSRSGHRVWVIGRSREVQVNGSTRMMADAYAAQFKQVLGPSAVVGISLGGLVAQHLAIAHSTCVTRLVLAVSGPCIVARQRTQLHQWMELARAGQWEELNLRLAVLMQSQLADGDADLVRSFLGGALQRRPQDPAHFLTCVAASLAHDTTALLERIAVPTLLVGGARDPLFPPECLYAAARMIPDARAVVVPEAGHGVFDEQRRRFDRELATFLRFSDGGVAAAGQGDVSGGHEPVIDSGGLPVLY